MITTLVAALILATSPVPAVPAISTGPVSPATCTYSRRHTIDSSSSWADQFRCYQAAGRHISIPGTSYQTNTIIGDLCIQVVTDDRVQLAPCSTLSGDAAIILSYSAIFYVVDDPETDAVSVFRIGGPW